MQFETERLKSELFSSDFRQCLKSELFVNRTISKSAEIRTFRCLLYIGMPNYERSKSNFFSDPKSSDYGTIVQPLRSKSVCTLNKTSLDRIPNQFGIQTLAVFGLTILKRRHANREIFRPPTLSHKNGYFTYTSEHSVKKCEPPTWVTSFMNALIEEALISLLI